MCDKKQIDSVTLYITSLHTQTHTHAHTHQRGRGCGRQTKAAPPPSMLLLVTPLAFIPSLLFHFLTPTSLFIFDHMFVSRSFPVMHTGRMLLKQKGPVVMNDTFQTAHYPFINMYMRQMYWSLKHPTFDLLIRDCWEFIP